MFDAFARLSVSPVTSELTLAELLCNRDLSPQTQRVYMNLIVYKKVFDLRPGSRSILLGSAALRRDNPACKLADAVHVQTALDAQCTMVMTNGLRFSHFPAALTLVRPTADGVSSILGALNG